MLRNRPTLILLCLLFGPLLVLPSAGSLMTATAVGAAQPLGRPNIVFLIADDLGWRDVAFHGGSAPTPHLDQLLTGGLELTQHYVAPVCSPTRCGLLTGRYWSRFGITTPTNELALPPDTMTLPRALRHVGYDTCLAGKWHLGSLPQWGPNHFGFDHSYGSLAGGISPWNHRYKKGIYSRTWHRNHKLIEETGHVTDLLTREAIGWIESRGDRPFFLYVPFTAVHLPLKEPKEWLARVPDQITGDVPRHYAASIMHLDDAVGQIIAALDRQGFRRNTLVVFTSDNGGSTAENNDLKYPDDNCPNGRLPGNNLPLRGKKGDVYEGGTRVPTIVSWPGVLTAGKINTALQIVDWMPTFCSLAGYQPDRPLKWDGMNLMPLLTGEAALPVRSLYTAGPRWRAMSLRRGDWKLIVHEADRGNRSELYHLGEDEGETRNRAGTNPDQLRILSQALQQARANDRDAVAN